MVATSMATVALTVPLIKGFDTLSGLNPTHHIATRGTNRRLACRRDTEAHQLRIKPLNLSLSELLGRDHTTVQH